MFYTECGSWIERHVIVFEVQMSSLQSYQNLPQAPIEVYTNKPPKSNLCTSATILMPSQSQLEFSSMVCQ